MSVTGPHPGHSAPGASATSSSRSLTTGVPATTAGRCAGGDIPADVPDVVAGVLARHAPAAARMNDF